jgi:hypothetical protein
LLAAVVVVATVASACAAPSSPQTSVAVASASAGSAAGRSTASQVRPAPVVVILMENHSYGQIAGAASAPYLNRFAHRGTLFTDMNAVSHPSLPNYLAITSGSTLGCTSDACPPRSFGAKNIFEQLRATGRTWASWEESMPGRCVLHNAGTYAVRHNAATYYRDLFPHDCPRHDRSFPTTLPRRLPDFTFVTPNLCHDMHDCSVATGDTWLRHHVPSLLALGAVVVITFDEGEGSNHIFCAARGPGVGHAVRRAGFTHYGLLGGIERHFGLRRLRRAATARPVPL